MIDIRSDKSYMLFSVLSDGKTHSANELSFYIEEKSRQIYPRLKPYRKILEITRVGRINYYQIKNEIINVVKNALNIRRSLFKAINWVKKVLSDMNYKLNDEALKIIVFLINFYKNTKKRWLEADKGNNLNVAEIIARATKLDYETVASELRSLIAYGIIVPYPDSKRIEKLRVTETVLKMIP
ncbi:MAG: hypothetical protein C0172_04235 [Caldisphaera sp.]|nr:MAG: hypothetical protein C0172_04235 [Caldisphaera sp.]